MRERVRCEIKRSPSLFRDLERHSRLPLARTFEIEESEKRSADAFEGRWIAGDLHCKDGGIAGCPVNSLSCQRGADADERRNQGFPRLSFAVFLGYVLHVGGENID